MVCVCINMCAQEQKDEVPQTTQPQQVRVSETVLRGLIVKKVPPQYPSVARQQGIQGSVVMQVEISTSGDVKNIDVLSGDMMLAPAAVKAVKQWKYKPYRLNGTPVEVKTEITLNFRLH